MGDFRSSLGPFAGAMRDPDPERLKELAVKLYEKSDGKIVLISTDWLPGWGDQKLAQTLAHKAYDVKVRL